MRILLDEQLPRRLVRELTGHEVRTVQQEGWAGVQNGELLRRAGDSPPESPPASIVSAKFTVYPV